MALAMVSERAGIRDEGLAPTMISGRLRCGRLPLRPNGGLRGSVQSWR
jgi:hypothetical protein